jgi:hypothetical protein
VFLTASHLTGKTSGTVFIVNQQAIFRFTRHGSPPPEGICKSGTDCV